MSFFHPTAGFFSFIAADQI